MGRSVSELLETAVKGIFGWKNANFRSYLLFLSDSNELAIRYQCRIEPADIGKRLWNGQNNIAIACTDGNPITLDVPECVVPADWARDNNHDAEYIEWMRRADQRSAIFYPIETVDGDLAFVYVNESSLAIAESMLMNDKKVTLIGAMGYKLGNRLPEFESGKRELKKP